MIEDRREYVDNPWQILKITIKPLAVSRYSGCALAEALAAMGFTGCYIPSVIGRDDN